MKQWLTSRFVTVFDNFIWLILLAVISALVFFYKKDPQMSLLWVLLILSVANALVISLVYYRIRADKKPSLHTNHRNATAGDFDRAFKTGGEVWIVSIMSQHTLKEFGPHLKNANASKTMIHALTLDPEIDSKMANAIQLHLNEPPHTPDATMKQIKAAWELWLVFSKQYPNVLEVRKYKSLPTLQGVLVKDNYVTVELMLYNTHPNKRPGILLTQKDDPDLFDIFQEKFLELWKAQA